MLGFIKEKENGQRQRYRLFKNTSLHTQLFHWSLFINFVDFPLSLWRCSQQLRSDFLPTFLLCPDLQISVTEIHRSDPPFYARKRITWLLNWIAYRWTGFSHWTSVFSFVIAAICKTRSNCFGLTFCFSINFARRSIKEPYYGLRSTESIGKALSGLSWFLIYQDFKFTDLDILSQFFWPEFHLNQLSHLNLVVFSIENSFS